MFTKPLLYAALILTVLVPVPPAAARDAVSTWQLMAGLRYADFHYEENHKGETLNEEDGYLPGVELGLEWSDGRWFAGGELDYSSGEVDYDGQTNLGSSLETDTDEEISHGMVMLGRWFRNDRAPIPIATGLYAGGGYRHWLRDIQSTPTVTGLEETYRWPYAAIGSRIAFTTGERNRWTVDGRLVYPIDPEMEVDSHGLFEKTTLDLGAQLGGRAALRWSRALQGQWQLSATAWVERWELGRSDVETASSPGGTVSLFEPDSDTTIIGITLSLGWTL